ncbi:hypothetical protein Ancab_011956 [Ancistrocladus abbreviatus]
MEGRKLKAMLVAALVLSVLVDHSDAKPFWKTALCFAKCAILCIDKVLCLRLCIKQCLSFPINVKDVQEDNGHSFCTIGCSLSYCYAGEVKDKGGVIVFGPTEEKEAINGAGWVRLSAPVEDFNSILISHLGCRKLLCKLGTLDPRKVEGKIIACLRGETARVDKGLACLQAGAAGMILCNDYANRNSLSADVHYFPATQVAYKDGVEIFNYIKSTDKPVAFLIDPGADRRNQPAPLMASFSSVGPNTITPEILKLDITAPGINVIAAYNEAANPTMVESDKRRSPYMIMSGTSMSCPHVSGVVARARDNSFHPMEDSSHFEATPFEYGAGHIQPNRAMDPGLVYDLTFSDYLNFLCDIGYNETLFKQFQNGTYACLESTNLYDLNYPSIAVPKLSGSLTLTRTVKNVGRPGTYVAHVRQPSTVSIFVEPMTLKFEKIGEERSFHVTLKAKAVGEPRGYAFESLTWLDGHHYVRSPIVVTAAT